MIKKKINFNSNSWDHILSKFTKNVGLLDKIFGWEGLILYNEEKEKIKLLLKEVYNLNVYDMFNPELDEKKIDRTLKTIFRFNDLNIPEDDEISIFGN